jgi:hypothetical protein
VEEAVSAGGLAEEHAKFAGDRFGRRRDSRTGIHTLIADRGRGSVVEVMVMLMRAPGVGETLRNADCVPRLCLELDDSPHRTASHQLQHQRPDIATSFVHTTNSRTR